MKIRKATDTSDMRGKTTKDRVCEDCKQIRVEGVYLNLGYFFGFLCNDCANRLAFLIREAGIWYEAPQLINNPDFVKVESFPTKLEDQPDFIKEIIRNTKHISDEDITHPIRLFPMSSLQPVDDTPTSRPNDIVDLFGDKVTQKDYDALTNRLVATEKSLELSNRFKLDIAMAFDKLKSLIQSADDSLTAFEREMDLK